jgi:hypothetical protein
LTKSYCESLSERNAQKYKCYGAHENKPADLTSSFHFSPFLD